MGPDMARQPVRPRYRRIAAAGGSVAITMVAVLGGTGVLPIDGTAEPAQAQPARSAKVSLSGWVSSSLPRPGRSPATERPVPTTAPEPAEQLPAGSGHGRRVVFDIGDQRVWLVDANQEVVRTYPVSGSVTGNLGPGRYAVYSRSRYAVGIDDSGTMQYMVRFTQGENAAIGFHDIPVKDGERVQTREELGTPQSHGCIRQWRDDAKALWRFAPVGTPVVVT